MITKVLKRADDGTIEIDTSRYDRRPSRLPRPVQNILYYDVDQEQDLDKEQFDKRVNRICYGMLCVMGTVLTVGFVIIVVIILLNRK